MIPQEKLNNIHKLHLNDVSLILDECIEALGLCDIETSCNALGVQRSRIYQIMNKSNTKQIGKHKYLMINVYEHDRTTTTSRVRKMAME